MKLWTTLEHAAKLWPDRICVVDERAALTFSELRDLALSLSEKLEAQGLGARDGFGIRTLNGHQFLVALFAGFRLGAVVLPLSHQLKPSEVESMLKEAPVHMILDDGSGCALDDMTLDAEVLEEAGTLWRLWKCSAKRRNFCPHIPDAALARYTSGTTGKAKGVILTHDSALERTQAAQAAFQFTQEDVVVWVLPMAHHFVVTLLTYVRYGVKVAVSRDMLAQSILDTALKHHGTVLYAAPMHYRLLAAAPSASKLDTLRLAVSTSAAISPVIAKQFEDRFKLPVRQVYGIIELGIPAADLGTGVSKPDTVGRALPGFEIAVLNKNFAICPTGTVGKLAMRGPGMFDGYLRPELRREQVLQNGWFLTGDLASIDQAGYIRVEGREKSMINVSGNKVFPEEVEQVLNMFDGVRESRVFSEEHPIMGEIVIAEIVPECESRIAPEALRRHCRERLSAYKLPHDIRFVQALEHTLTGKIVRVFESQEVVNG